MSSNGGGGAGGSKGNGTVTVAGIPAGVRKMVQSLKEIVNLPDQEIYVTLKECGMDPSEAVQRLLSQDSFHEVKSKRDKKKELKEPPDSRSRTTNNISGRGVRSISDRVLRTSPIQSISNGYGGSRGKAVQKKEDGVGSVPSSSNVGSNSSSVSRKLTIMSEHTSENLWQATGSVNGSSLHSQPLSGYPHTWTGMPGQFSMADIVKMGRPQGKLSASSMVAGNSLQFSHNQIASDTNDKHSVNPVWPSEFDQRVHSSQGPHLPAEEIDIESETTRNERVSDDGWPSVNHPNSETFSAILETSGDVTSNSDSSKAELIVDEAQLHQTLDEDEISEPDQSSNSESLSESESEVQLNNSADKSKLENGSFQDLSAYLSQRHSYGQQVDDDNVEISSTASNLQNLRLQKNGLSAPSLEDNPAVIIPRHLQVTNMDCSHLSFGSFGSGLGASFSGSLQQKPLHDNSEVTKDVDDIPSLDDSEARNPNYYDNDELKSQINEDVVSRGGIDTTNYNLPPASEPELIRDDAVNSTELQYNFPSLSGYGTSTSGQHSTTAFSHPQTNLQMQNLASLSTLMQPYSSSLPSSFLAPTLQPLRDIDLPFSSLLATQSLPSKNNVTSSISGPAISMHEPKQSVFSNLQQVPQSSSSSNLPAGHAIPQHLHINPYSQATLPLGPFANVISYPFLPQSYTYLPSAAFPQAYTSNGPFHQSTSALHNAGLKYTLPQYKSSLSVTSLPQPASVASAYGNYNGSSNIPGNFVLNPSSTSTSTTLGFDEALSSQKEAAHFLHLQQNDSSPMWIHSGNSRTVSPLPPNTFYGFQGQSQLNNFRQAQQPAHYGPMGYLNLYQNHQLSGQSQEHQHNPNEANLTGSQNNPSQQSHQIWQHGY